MARSNLAYDYRRLAEREAAKAPQIREVRKQESHEEKRTGLSMAKVSVMLVVVVAMLSALLYTRVVQVEVTREYNRAETTLAAMKSENSTLMKQLENKLSIANIEAIALDQLGMQKLENRQIQYITFETEDVVEVVQSPNLFEQIGSFFAGLFS